jgi:hypothetical protein
MFVKGSGQNEQSYRGHSIDTSYQVSVHLAKRFQRRFSKIGISETRIACGGHISRSINKHGRHMQFLFPIGGFV